MKLKKVLLLLGLVIGTQSLSGEVFNKGTFNDYSDQKIKLSVLKEKLKSEKNLSVKENIKKEIVKVEEKINKYSSFNLSNGIIGSYDAFLKKDDKFFREYNRLTVFEILKKSKIEKDKDLANNMRKDVKDFLESLDLSIIELESILGNKDAENKFEEKMEEKIKLKNAAFLNLEKYTEIYTEDLDIYGEEHPVKIETRILENRLDINENAYNIEKNSNRINYLENKINDLEGKMDSGISQVAAMSAFESGNLNAGEFGIGAGIASHNSTQSVAIGSAYAVTENFKITGKIAATPKKRNGSYTAAIGAFYKFSK